MPSRVAQSDPTPNSISTNTSQPLDARAQDAALATYNTAIDQLNAAQANLDAIGTRPANDANGYDAGGKQWDEKYAGFSDAVAAAKTQAAQSARQYATILQAQATESAKDTSPAGQAKAAQAQAQAEYVQAKADGYAAKSQADIDAAKTRADAARTRANALLNKADQYQTADALYIRDPISGLYSKAVDSSGNPLPGSVSAASTAETTARTALTDAQTAKAQADADLARATQPDEIAAAKLKVNLAQAQVDKAQADNALAAATQPDEIAAAKIKVQTAQQALDQARALAPGAVDQQGATLASTQANTTQTQQTTTQRNAPTVVGSPTPTDKVIINRDPNTGVLTNQPNPNTTDIGAQVQQLQTKAQTFRDNLQTQVLNGSLSQADAQQKFNDFWTTQVEPQRQALIAAQQKDQFAQGLQARTEANTEEQDRATSNLNTYNAGQTAGDAAVKQTMDMLPLQVGPQYGQHMAEAINGLASGHPTSNFSSADFTSNMPDLNSIRQTAVAHALKGISPYAASLVGAPMPTVPQGVDINSLLNQSNYGGTFSGPPPSSGSAPGPSSPTTQISPDGTVTIQHVPSYSGGTSSPLGATPVTPADPTIPVYQPQNPNNPFN